MLGGLLNNDDNDLDEGLVQPMMWLRQGETGSELEGIVGIYRWIPSLFFMFGQNDVIAVFIFCCCFDLKPVSLAHAWAGGGGRVGVGAGRKKTEHILIIGKHGIRDHCWKKGGWQNYDHDYYPCESLWLQIISTQV